MDALTEAGIALDTGIVWDLDANEKQAEARTNELLHMDNRPTALLCTNDTIAVGAVKAVLRAGLRVPEDLAIIGFDDSIVSRVIEPELTTVRIDSYRLGELAAELLFQLIDGETLRQDRITISTELIVRGTT